MKYKIRPVTEADGDAVIEIINYYIDNSFAAYPEKHFPSSFFDELRDLAGIYPFYVAETDRHQVIGFALIRPYHIADTLRRTAEIGYYIAAPHTGKGLGERLLKKLIAEAKAIGIDIFLASISSLNEGSFRFHAKHGFVECGRFKRVGIKRKTEFDMIWMQKFL